MKRKSALLTLALLVVLSASSFPSKAAAPEQRPIEMADIMAWKTIATSVVSNDGRWFAYRVSPIDGDSAVVIRQIQGDKELKFPVGEATAGGGRDLAFSDDSKWVAFTVYPTKKEAQQAKKQRKPLQNKVRLLNLAAGTDSEMAKIRRFAFSGEKAGWIALHRYGPEGSTPASGPPPAGPPPAAAGGGAPAEDRPKGSDLILRELGTGTELNIGNVADFAFDKGGRWFAWTVDAQDKAGNGVTLRDMDTGVVTPLDGGKASYERMAWTEKGDALAVLKGVEDKKFKDKLYSVVGWTGFASGKPQKVAYDPATDKLFPAGMTISMNRTPTWTEDLAAIIIGISKPKTKTDEEAKPADKPTEGAEPEKPAADDTDEKPDLVLWHWLDKRLQSQQQVQEQGDKSYSYVSVYRIAEKKFVRLADDDLRDVIASPKGRWAVGQDLREYELMSNLDGRRYQDIYAIDMQTGARKLALKKVRWFNGLSPDGDRFLYYEDGQYFVYDVASGQAANITKTVPASFVNTNDDHNVVKPPVPPIGWTKDGASVLLSDGWDVWNVPVAPGQATNLTVTGKRDAVRYRGRVRLDPDEKGIDLSVPQYFMSYGEWTKKGGIVRIEPGKPGAQPLLSDDAAFGRVMKAKNADVYLYTRATYKEFPDFYVGDGSLANGRKITSVGVQRETFAWSAGSMLIDYTSAKGDRLQGALFLPANYEKGKAYPTLVYIYEKLSQGLNEFTSPSANGFNKSVYTSNGYAVLMPDITYKLNDPGMSAVWCVVPALKAAIATGVVDKDKIGLQGHSWGGYQTAFLVTQTDMFAAAVAGAPLTNMVSMYSLIYKNSGSTNQPIFESSQGRFLGGYWDNWEAYVRNSPVNFAKNVRTPLMILHNDKDGAVDFTQGVEYYNTLRRLRKPVIMLEYIGENHGLAKRANQKDYTVRMREFFDHYLMGKPMPRWMKEGVRRLDMEDHLKERTAPKPVKIITQ
jgi:fermentation-respiration switch protein FrsA (DUF1100 family)